MELPCLLLLPVACFPYAWFTAGVHRGRGAGATRGPGRAKQTGGVKKGWWQSVGGLSEKSKGIKKYRSALRKQSQDIKYSTGNIVIR